MFLKFPRVKLYADDSLVSEEAGVCIVSPSEPGPFPPLAFAQIFTRLKYLVAVKECGRF